MRVGPMSDYDFSTTELGNARSVFLSWSTGAHREAWDEPAASMPPSQTVALVALAWERLATTADAEADLLIMNGFRRLHPAVTSLRNAASDAARQGQRQRRWAAALRVAEQEADR